MTDRDLVSRKVHAFFEELWQKGDPWEFETSEFEHRRCDRLFEILAGRRYTNVLEIGCGAGMFTRLLARLADRVVALDISTTAIECAKAAQPWPSSIEFQVANIMEYDAGAEGPWDLVVLSDTIYFIGWLYSFFDIGWLAKEIFDATRHGGRLLLPNCFGGAQEHLMSPFLIRTYRDLFVNVGYQIKTEENFRGTKNSAEIDMLITLFEKPQENGHP
jgi:SAM-dependent methyltransferase